MIRIFQYSESAADWVQLGQDITRENDDDELDCTQINLSADGMTVVSGYRGYEKDCPEYNVPRGHLRVWSWDTASETWSRKGVDIDTLFPDPNLDHDFSFGFKRDHHISADGNRISVSGMEKIALNRVDDEKFVFYIVSFEWDGNKWGQLKGTVETPPYPAWAMDDEGKHLAVSSLIMENRPSGLVQTYTRHEQVQKDSLVSVQ